jgi:hypothetical protein
MVLVECLIGIIVQLGRSLNELAALDRYQEKEQHRRIFQIKRSSNETRKTKQLLLNLC